MSRQPKIEPLRREMQRAYLDILKNEFTPAYSNSPASRPVGRGGSSSDRVSELGSAARMLRALSVQ